MLNRSEFIGNLGAAPEVRSLQDGTKVANFSLGCSERWKDKTGQKQEHTEWIRCTVYGALAEVVEKYVSKGSKVYVAGKWKTRKWQDQSGQDKYTTECQVKELVMLDSKGAGQPSQHEQAKQNGYQPQVAIDDDIPFTWVLPLIISFAALGGVA